MQKHAFIKNSLTIVIIQIGGCPILLPYIKKVKDFDKPLSALYQNNLGKKKIADHEFKFQRPKRKVPFSVLTNGESLVIFHNFDGDGNFYSDGANSIIKMYINLNNENIRKIQNYNRLNYRFLYFLDSDDQGVDARLESLKQSLQLPHLNSHEIIVKGDYELGCYIFHDESHTDKHGKLENILLQLMSLENEAIFEKGLEFIENNELEVDRKRKFICTDNQEEYSGTVQFKKDKSIISSAGQLQFSGASNAVIIANSDYIQKDNILTNRHCIDIAELFNT